MGQTPQHLARWLTTTTLVIVSLFSYGWSNASSESLTEPCAGVRTWIHDALWLWVAHPVDINSMLITLENVEGDDLSPEAIREITEVGAALTSRSQAASELNAPRMAQSTEALLVEHDAKQGSGLLLIAQAASSGDEAIAEAGADLVSEAKELGKKSSLALQQLVVKCHLYGDPEMVEITGCIDAMAAMSGSWGDYVNYDVPVMATLASFPLDPQSSTTAAETLDRTAESAEKYQKMTVPRGAESIDEIIRALHVASLYALEQADAGNWMPLQSLDGEMQAWLQVLGEEREAMYAPCTLMFQ